MIASATRQGLAGLRRHPVSALTLWLLNLVLALAAGVPGFLALRSAHLPAAGGDALADGFQPGCLVDLVEMRRGSSVASPSPAVGVAFWASSSGAATGGALEVLMSRDDRLSPTALDAGPAVSSSASSAPGSSPAWPAPSWPPLLAGPILAVGGRLRRESGSEVLSNIVSLSGLAVAGLVFLLALLALDAARVRIVREDARRVLPMLRSGFAVVLSHP